MNRVDKLTDKPNDKIRHAWLAPLITCVFGGAFIAGAWQAEGKLAAQRIMVDLIMPVGLVWLGSLYATIAFWKNDRRKTSLMTAALFVFISVLFSPLTCRLLMRRIEGPAPKLSPLAENAPTYRAVVVLGGGASLGREGTAQLNSDGHRVAMAAQLWHAGKVSAIICTGDDNYVPDPLPNGEMDLIERDRWNPARLGIELLVSLGVPADVIYRVGGTHTAAEMENLAAFFSSPPETFPTNGELGLITSAFHMPRAMRLATGKNLKFIPIPVSYRTGPREPVSIVDLVPSANAGQLFYMGSREMLARIVGR